MALRMLRTNPHPTLTWKQGRSWVISDPVRVSVDGVPADVHFDISTVGGWGAISAILNVYDPNFPETHPAAHERLKEMFSLPSVQHPSSTYYETRTIELEDEAAAKREARVLLSELRALGLG